MCDSTTKRGPLAGGGSDGSGPAPGGASASLEPPTGGDLETNPHAASSDEGWPDGENVVGIESDLQRAVFGADAVERRRIVEALGRVEGLPWASRCRRMTDCCQVPAVGLTASGAVGAVWFRCRDRLCPLCSRCRGRQVAERVHAATAKADSLRFATFTIAHSDAPLVEQMDQLQAWFRAFRRTAEWKKHVRGGVATIELKRGKGDGRWHPHLHMLLDGEYWDQAALSNAWRAVTGTSFIVDIRLVHSRKDAAFYVAKYASKPPRLDRFDDADIQDVAAALHRRRMIMTFGSMHNVPVDGDEERERESISDARVPLGQVERRSRFGCVAARVVLRALAESSRVYARSIERRPEHARPVLAERSAETLAAAPRAAHELADKWRLWPQWFGSRLDEPQPPPVPDDPPGSRIDPADTPPLMSSWLEPERRRW